MGWGRATIGPLGSAARKRFTAASGLLLIPRISRMFWPMRTPSRAMPAEILAWISRREIEVKVMMLIAVNATRTMTAP